MKNYFETPERQAALVAELESWLRTPFREKCAVKGPRGGTDCVMFVQACLVSQRAIPAEDLPRYTAEMTQQQHNREMTRWLNERPYFARIAEFEGERMPDLSGIGIIPGDIFTFRVLDAAHHLAIADSARSFIHCTRQDGVIRSWIDDSSFFRRLMGVYRITA